MTDADVVARMRQIAKRKRELAKELKSLEKEETALLIGEDTTRRSPHKSLSPQQIGALLAGI